VRIQSAIVTVGAGRGFVADVFYRRLVLTAAQLPAASPAAAAASEAERRFRHAERLTS
jgi:hypothetical protein